MSEMDLDRWSKGEPCERDGNAYCYTCKPRNLPATVYMTRGGSSTFHASSTCRALRDGQAKVKEPAEAQLVPVATALMNDKAPCLQCFAELQGRIP